MHGVYNPLLTCLSVVVAFLASFAALEGAAMLSGVANDRWRIPWLVGSACAMGIGIWSMHFIGMIALKLPIVIGYDIDATAASLALAVIAAVIALATVSRGSLSMRRLLAAGVVMGSGVAAMHYIGMIAMRMSPSIEYEPVRVVLSVAIAIGASIVALWLAFRLRDSRRKHIFWKRIGAAAVMAFAIAGMHYTGMSAASFADGSRCLSTNKVDANALAITVGTASTLVLIGTLWIFGTQASRLSASLDRATLAIRHLGTHDALTDLPNRAYLMAWASELVQGNTRTDETLAVLFIDLDGFKAVNDTLGHKLGDGLLRQAASRISACASEGDLVARLGGDEFVLVATGLPDDVNGSIAADRIAQQILASLAAEFMLEGAIPVHIGASIGTAVARRENASLDTLLGQADCAMYAAKRSGRNTFRRFEDGMSQSTLRALHIQRDLHGALRGDQFELRFQPEFSIDGKMSGAEARICWTHPVFGEVRQHEFVPLAEGAGLMVPIGDWVLRRICRQIGQWNREGLASVPISLALSAAQLNLPRLVDHIDRIVTVEGVSPPHLMFQISEADAMQDAGRTRRVVMALRQRGYAVALTGFGASLSQLVHFEDFCVDEVEVDRAFVRSLENATSRDSAMIAAVMALARVIGSAVGAEGVETVTQSTRLFALECDRIKGALYASPLAPDEFQRALAGLSGAEGLATVT